MKIRAKFAIHIEESLIICHCQVDQLDFPNIGNIAYVSKYIVSLW